MKALIKEPNKNAVVMDIENTLETLQTLVGGWIEFVPQGGVGIIVNEEGKLMGLPYNFTINYDDIVGTAVFVGLDDESDDFTDIPDEDAEFLMRYFNK